jgi:hypothetical protein
MKISTEEKIKQGKKNKRKGGEFEMKVRKDIINKRLRRASEFHRRQTNEINK